MLSNIAEKLTVLSLTVMHTIWQQITDGMTHVACLVNYLCSQSNATITYSLLKIIIRRTYIHFQKKSLQHEGSNKPGQPHAESYYM